MSCQSKPTPRLTNETSAYWQGCREGKLLVQTCCQCGHRQFYPRTMCMRCLGMELEMVESSGRGEVHAFTIVRRAPSPAFEADLPYVVALVDLKEGVRMMSTIVECPVDAVHSGMPVDVVFDEMSPEVTLPRFRPRPATSATEN